jgi:hypothetical protein
MKSNFKLFSHEKKQTIVFQHWVGRREKGEGRREKGESEKMRK